MDRFCQAGKCAAKQRRKPELPAYNIESDDNHYRITLALAGFRQEDLDIQLEGARLTVKSTPEQPENEPKWIYIRALWSCSL